MRWPGGRRPCLPRRPGAGTSIPRCAAGASGQDAEAHPPLRMTLLFEEIEGGTRVTERIRLLDRASPPAFVEAWHAAVPAMREAAAERLAAVIGLQR